MVTLRLSLQLYDQIRLCDTKVVLDPCRVPEQWAVPRGSHLRNFRLEPPGDARGRGEDTHHG